MSVGARLREERERLRLSQPAFAALANASKGAQANWEKDVASPNAAALIAFAEGGADVLYILTGRRTVDRSYTTTSIRDDLAEVRRDLMDPTRFRQPSDADESAADERAMARARGKLRNLLEHDRAFLDDDMLAEIEHLRDLADNPAGLALVRAHDWAQKREARQNVRSRIAAWLEGGAYEPGPTVMNLLAAMSIEHGVPAKALVELVTEIREDMDRARDDPR